MLPINERWGALTRIQDASSEPVVLADAKTFARISITDDDALVTSLIVRARKYCEEITNRSFFPQRWRLTLQNWPGRDWTNTTVGLGFSNIEQYYRYNYIELPRAAPLISLDSFLYFDTSHIQYALANPTDYIVDYQREPARVVLPYLQVWPTRVLDTAQPIQLSYTAGTHPPVSDGAMTSGLPTLTSLTAFFGPGDVGKGVTIGGAGPGSPGTTLSSSIAAYVSSTQVTLADNASNTVTGAALKIGEQLPEPLVEAMLMLMAHWYENREAMVVGRSAQIASEIRWAVDELLWPYRLSVV